MTRWKYNVAYTTSKKQRNLKNISNIFTLYASTFPNEGANYQTLAEYYFSIMFKHTTYFVPCKWGYLPRGAIYRAVIYNETTVSRAADGQKFCAEVGKSVTGVCNSVDTLSQGLGVSAHCLLKIYRQSTLCGTLVEWFTTTSYGKGLATLEGSKN